MGRKRTVKAQPKARRQVTDDVYDEAVRTLESYKLRMPEWRQLPFKDRARTLRVLFTRQERVACCAPNCSSSFTTYNGLLYHLDRCTLSVEEMSATCPFCKAKIPYLEMEQHDCLPPREHGQRARRKSSIAAASVLKLDDGESGSSDVESTKNAEASDNYVPESDNEEQSTSSDGEDDRRKIYFTHMEKKYSRNSALNAKVPVDGTWEAFRSANFCDNLFPELDCRESEWRHGCVELHSTKVRGVRYYSQQIRLANMDQWDGLQLFESRTEPCHCVGYCGMQVIALAWCPTADCSEAYILASLYNDGDSALARRPTGALFQLWRLVPDSTLSAQFSNVWTMEHDLGMVADVKWCPSGVFRWPSSEADLGRLGSFAAVSSSGNVAIYCVPLRPASDLRCPFYSSGSVRPNLWLVGGPPGARSIGLDWSPFGGHQKIAVVSEAGFLGVWNLSHVTVWNDGVKVRPEIMQRVCMLPVLMVAWYTESIVLMRTTNGHVLEFSLLMNSIMKDKAHTSKLGPVAVAPYLPGYYCSLKLKNPSVCAQQMFSPGEIRPATLRNPLHAAAITNLAFMPYKTSAVSVDQEGTVAICKVLYITTTKNRQTDGKFAAKVAFRTQFDTNQGVEPRLIFKLMDFDSPECTRKPGKENLALLLDNCYAALYGLACSPNKTAADWVCFGGEAGFLHVLNVGKYGT